MKLFFFALFLPLFAQAEPPCLSEALHRLETADPQGLRDLSLGHGRAVFTDFLSCDRPDLFLTHAFHEGVHGATREFYPLADGSRHPFPKGIQFEPREILPLVNASAARSADTELDFFRDNYLASPKSTAKTAYYVLLNEMNAYARDLITTVRVEKDYPVRNQAGRDGTAAMMLFVKLVLYKAATEHPDDWARLQGAEHVALIRALWKQSETALRLACPYGDDLGIGDAPVLREVYSASMAAPLENLLGEKLQKPAGCP